MYLYIYICVCNLVSEKGPFFCSMESATSPNPVVPKPGGENPHLQLDSASSWLLPRKLTYPQKSDPFKKEFHLPTIDFQKNIR